MKKTKCIVSVVVIILVVAIIGCVLTFCGTKNEIIGEWKSNISSEYNCYFVLNFYENGTYEKIKYNSVLDIKLSSETGNYTIEGDTIECHYGNNESTVFKYNDGKITTGIYTYVKQK